MKTHKTDIEIHWGDCDPAVIVFYPNYFKWFDVSTTKLFDSVGLNLAELFKDDHMVGIPILDAGAKFMRPSRFQDVITVESGIESWGRSSFRIKHTITNKGHVCVEGHEVRAWVVVDPDHPNGIKAEPVPEEIKARFGEA
jgi:4-hydroxybenzoyl-CoA thioesterase